MLQVKGLVVLQRHLQAQGLNAVLYYALVFRFVNREIASRISRSTSRISITLHFHFLVNICSLLFQWICVFAFIIAVCVCIVTTFLFCVTPHLLSPKYAEKVSVNKRMTKNLDTKGREPYIYIWRLNCAISFRKRRQLIGGVNSTLQLETRRDAALTSKKDMIPSK